MNEQIEKLAKQAWVNIVTTKGMEDVEDGCYIVHPDRLQEFAELIVRECAEYVDTLLGDVDNPHYPDGEMIKEHFGVEE